MKNFDAATAAYIASRAGVVAHRLIWIKAENRATGIVENIGIWSGLRDRVFVVGGTPRIYRGAGALLAAEPIVSGPGLSVRTYEISLSAVAPEIEDLVKGYKTRGAPVEVHRALFHPATRDLVSDPRRVWFGRVDEITFPDGDIGGMAACVLSLVSETRALTRPLAVLKSAAAQALRGGDKLRRYSDVSGSVPVYWGEKRAN